MTDRKFPHGFAAARGETQVSGDRVLGIQPSPGPLPLGTAPPTRQVVSIFDTIPIGARPVRKEVVVNPPPPGEGVLFVSLLTRSVPGFVYLLREIELSMFPGTLASDLWTFTFQIAGSIIPEWSWSASSWITRRRSVYILIPPSTEFGLFAGNLFVSSGSPVTRAAYSGVAVPAAAAAVEEAHASGPVMTIERRHE